MNDYSVTITCPVSPEQAYAAITRHMSDWWTPMSADFLETGDTAKTGFGGPSYWVFKATTLDSPQRVELECVESRMIMDILDDPEEWKGTTLRFEITESGGGSEIVFTHIGLKPAMQCYEVCEGGWNHYIPGSLKAYLDGKGGTPNSY